jgi:hypothetical protein
MRIVLPSGTKKPDFRASAIIGEVRLFGLGIASGHGSKKPDFWAGASSDISAL